MKAVLGIFLSPKIHIDMGVPYIDILFLHIPSSEFLRVSEPFPKSHSLGGSSGVEFFKVPRPILREEIGISPSPRDYMKVGIFPSLRA